MSKVAIFLADGFETIEGLTVVDLCRRAGIDLVTVSISDSKRVMTSHKVPIETDILFSELDFDSMDMLVLPGGKLGTENLESCEPLMKKVDEFQAAGRNMAAICAAPRIFGEKGFLQGKKATCYPTNKEKLLGAEFTGSKLEIADNLITSRGMGTSTEFTLAIIERLEGKAVADDIAEAVTFER